MVLKSYVVKKTQATIMCLCAPYLVAYMTLSQHLSLKVSAKIHLINYDSPYFHVSLSPFSSLILLVFWFYTSLFLFYFINSIGVA